MKIFNLFKKRKSQVQASAQLLAKKYFADGTAAAFLEKRGNEYFVYGKFYEGKGYNGPIVKVDLSDISENLLAEIQQRHSLKEPLSPLAQAAVNTAWRKAAQEHLWFRSILED